VQELHEGDVMTLRRKTNPLLLMGMPARTMYEVEQDGQDVLDTLDQLPDDFGEDERELDQDLIRALLPDD
jgi:hypothetical protein